MHKFFKGDKKMTPSLNDLFQKVVDLDDNSKIALGIEAEKTIIAYLAEHFDNEDAAVLYAMLIGTYVGADGEISAREYAFCCTVFGLEIEPKEFCDMVSATASIENVEIMDKLMDSAPDDVKSAFVTFGLALCSIDNTMTPEEQALLAKYIA